MGGPKNVVGYYNCSNNQLTSLEGAPQNIDGFFDCSENNIMSLDGLEFKSFKKIDLKDNPIYPIVKDWVNRNDAMDLIEYFVDMNIIQGDKLIHERLFMFYTETGLFDFPGYNIVKMS